MKWGNEKLDMGLDLRSKKFDNISILISNVLTLFPRLITSLLFMLMLGASLSLAAEPNYPNYIGYVNDFAGVLDPQTKQQINDICVSLEATTKAELAVVIVKTTAPLDSKSYVVKLFEKWKVGKKGLDNGVIFLLASDDRRVEIEVGYGLEGDLNDAKAGEILDQFVVPSFKKGNFSDGMLLGTSAIAKRIIDKYQKVPQKQEPLDTGATIFILGIAIAILIGFIALIIVLIRVFGFNNIFIVLIGVIAGFFVAGIIGAVIGLIFGIISLMMNSKGGRGDGGFFGSGGGGWFGGWSSGGGSDFGGGDSFGGFGGGDSGGGGAGRSF